MYTINAEQNVVNLDTFKDQFSSASLFEGGSPSKQNEPVKKEESITLPLSKFFGILTGKNKIMLVIGLFSSLMAGILMPSISVVMGSVTGSFEPNNEKSIDEIMGDLIKKIIAVAMVLWFFGYVQYAFMQQLAEIIAIDLRGKYLRALLKQEIAFFEMNNVETMPTDIG